MPADNNLRFYVMDEGDSEIREFDTKQEVEDYVVSLFDDGDVDLDDITVVYGQKYILKHSIIAE